MNRDSSAVSAMLKTTNEHACWRGSAVYITRVYICQSNLQHGLAQATWMKVRRMLCCKFAVPLVAAAISRVVTRRTGSAIVRLLGISDARH